MTRRKWARERKRWNALRRTRVCVVRTERMTPEARAELLACLRVMSTDPRAILADAPTFQRRAFPTWAEHMRGRVL